MLFSVLFFLSLHSFVFPCTPSDFLEILPAQMHIYAIRHVYMLQKLSCVKWNLNYLWLQCFSSLKSKNELKCGDRLIERDSNSEHDSNTSEKFIGQPFCRAHSHTYNILFFYELHKNLFICIFPKMHHTPTRCKFTLN